MEDDVDDVDGGGSVELLLKAETVCKRKTFFVISSLNTFDCVVVAAFAPAKTFLRMAGKSFADMASVRINGWINMGHGSTTVAILLSSLVVVVVVEN